MALTAEAEAMLSRSDAERIAYLSRDHVIKYPPATDIIEHAARLVRGERPMRSPYPYVSGRSNNGKSMIWREITALHPPYVDTCTGSMVYPVLSFSCVGLADMKTFCKRALRKLKAKIKPNAGASDLYDQLFELLPALGVKLILLDEIHNLLNTKSAVERKSLMNMIRDFDAELGISVMAFGVPEGLLSFSTDEQLANRFRAHELPLWKNDARTRYFLKFLEATLPLKHASRIHEGALAKKIILTGQYLIGDMVDIVRQAAVKAIEKKWEVIDERALDAIDWKPPQKHRVSLAA